jgi:hypothetical protein
MGKVDADLKDDDSQTLVGFAAEERREAIAKLLLAV